MMQENTISPTIALQARIFEGLDLTLALLTSRIDGLAATLKTLGDKIAAGGSSRGGSLSSGGASGSGFALKAPEFVDDYKAFFKELGGELKGVGISLLPKGVQEDIKAAEEKKMADAEKAKEDAAPATPTAPTAPTEPATPTTPAAPADVPVSAAGNGIAAESIEKTKELNNAATSEAVKNEGIKEKAAAKSWAGIVGHAILGSKKLAAIRKAMAIGEIVVDTAKAVMKAASSAPFPANLPGIAFAVATGAAQLAAVKGQAHDGLDHVPSTGTYLLEQGERVVDRRLNRDLKDFLSTGSQGAATGAGGTVTTNNTKTIAPNVNLTINGDPKPDAVYSNRGALESMIRDIFADYAMEAPFGR